MSVGVCIAGLEAEGQISPERAAELRARYDELIANYVRDASPETAEALASAQLIKALDAEATRKAFLAGKAIKARQRLLGDMDRFTRANGGKDGGPINPEAGPAFFDRSERATFSNVEARRKAVLGDAMRLLDKLMRDHSANLAGKVRNKAQLDQVVRELFLEGTGNPEARALATAWRKAAEMLRRRFNAAGGDIGFRSDWGLPQSHDWRAVRQAGFEAWRADIVERLDLSRMIDTATGLPMTREKLELLLPAIWDDIRTQGSSTRTPGSVPRQAMLAKLRSDARFFVFKSADDWLAYAERFGGGNAYDTMMGHIQGMARDIAALELLGPNPAATVDWIKQMLVDSAKLDLDPGSKAIETARGTGMKIDRLWDEYTGANLEPENRTLALTMSTVRNVMTGMKLGGALLSAVSDFGFSQTTRAFNGLNLDAGVHTYAKLFRPGSGELQKAAVRRGLIAEEWASRTATQARYSLEEEGAAWSRTFATGVLRLSGLQRHTQMLRWAYGMDTLADFTDARPLAFAELNDGMRGLLQRYGIDAADWDKLRSAPTETDQGAEWIAPHLLEDQELASRFMEMVHTETDNAVPVADLGTRALYNSKLRRGDPIGELGRSMLQFKGFGISVALRQWQRVGAMHANSDRLQYMAWLVAGTLITGAIAVQLKALAAGKDPRPMNDGRFALAALQQGGGFGIMGDFLFAEQSRTGGSIEAALAGPLIGDLDQARRIAISENPRGGMVRMAREFVPGGSLWYARTALDRAVADQVNALVNPQYRDSYRASERYARQQGTQYWWRPGELAPGRAPEFSNALEEGPPR